MQTPPCSKIQSGERRTGDVTSDSDVTSGFWRWRARVGADVPDLRCQSDLTSDFCLLGPIWVPDGYPVVKAAPNKGLASLARRHATTGARRGRRSAVPAGQLSLGKEPAGAAVKDGKTGADLIDGDTIAVKLSSSLFGVDVWLSFDEAFDPGDGLVVFHASELFRLDGKSPEELRAIFETRRQFPGARILQ